MVKLSDIKPNDYIIIKNDGPQLAIGKILHVTDPFVNHVEVKIIWKFVTQNKLNYNINFTWDLNFLNLYVESVINEPSQVKLIKLLYD